MGVYGPAIAFNAQGGTYGLMGTGGTSGVYGYGNVGVQGDGEDVGVSGNGVIGVEGYSADGIGVGGESTDGIGVRGGSNYGVAVKGVSGYGLSGWFGDTTELNFSQFDEKGVLRMNGLATVFDDLVMPLTTAKQGALDKPDFDYTNVGYLMPQNDATEILYLVVQMPHKWKEGSSIFPHVHYRRTSAGKPTFKIDYSWINIGSATSAPGTTLALDQEVTTYSSGSIHQINKSAAAISGTGKTISSLLLVKLYRDDNTVTGDVLTYQFDLHYEIDSLGSNLEYTKD